MCSQKKQPQTAAKRRHHPDDYAILVPAVKPADVHPGAAVVLPRQTWDSILAGKTRSAIAYFHDSRFEVLPFREHVLRAADFSALRHPTTMVITITQPHLFRVVGYYRRNAPRCDIVDASALVEWGVPAHDLLNAA